MEYDDTFNAAYAFAIDISGWEQKHRDFWTERLGRRYLLSVVPTRSRSGKRLEIGAAWYNRPEEVNRLLRDDILHIRQSKFGRSRLVPLHGSVVGLVSAAHRDQKASQAPQKNCSIWAADRPMTSRRIARSFSAEALP